MKTKKITITLTRLEAENLLLVASNMLDRPKDCKVNFGKGAWRAAAQAHDKIQFALHPTPIYVENI